MKSPSMPSARARLPFPGIWECVAAVMDAHQVQPSSTLEAVVAADQSAREAARAYCAATAVIS